MSKATPGSEVVQTRMSTYNEVIDEYNDCRRAPSSARAWKLSSAALSGKGMFGKLNLCSWCSRRVLY